MSLGPILPGRLPNSLASAHLKGVVQRINHQLSRLQDQAGTGQKYFLPSESPTSAIRAIALQRTLERQEHFQSSITAGKEFLTITETTLDTVGTAANRAKAIVLSGLGSTSTQAEKEALALEVDSLIQSVLGAANAENRGRYLYGGSEGRTVPFESVAPGIIRYNGDQGSIETRVSADLTLESNVDGAAAFNALSPPVTRDVNAALSLSTRLTDTLASRGVSLGVIQVTVDDGVNPVSTQSVDLTGAETVADVVTRLEGAFPAGSLTVDIDPATRSGLRLTAGVSVAVTDVTGSRVARDLGILGGPAATINGTDLDPRVTLRTRLADFNGGLGLQDATDDIRIVNGPKSATVDVSSAVTVEDLFNLLEQQNLDLALGINDDGNGLAISSRLSGASFSIGEDGGLTATDLGIRTFTGGTLLADLNGGSGVPVDANSSIRIRLTNGTQHDVSLSGALTVQDVIDRINAVGDPNLTASLNAIGNGITVADSSVGAAGFQIEANPTAIALGIHGSLPGSGTLAGDDVNPQESQGILNVLLRLSQALRDGDDQTLTHLDSLIDRQVTSLSLVRGDVGSRLRFLDEIENRLLDQNVFLEESLSKEFDADLTDVITRLANVTTALQATLQMAAQAQQLTLMNFL